jgi:hypothetical protein
MRRVASQYRKKDGSDTWHWCSNCQHYPTSGYTTHTNGRPSSGELCNECLGKEKNGTCT